ncbi:unnamed protein product [Lampetra fluviatilis]
MHTGTARALATPDPGRSSARREGLKMLGGAQDEKLGGVMGDETVGHDGDTDEDERQGGGDEDSDHDSISHVILGTKRKRAPPLHSSSSSDTDYDLFITQLPVLRKRASPHELGEGSSSASHEDVCGTGDADGTSTGEEAPRDKLKGQVEEEELHHRNQNKSRTPKGPKQCGARPSSPKARRLPQPLIQQYQGAAVWGLLACSKQLKQQHWSKYIQRICNGTRTKTLTESEENVFLVNSFEALVEDTDENVREEMCGEGGVDDTDRVEIRVVDPNSFILNVVSDAKPALTAKSKAKTATTSLGSQGTRGGNGEGVASHTGATVAATRGGETKSEAGPRVAGTVATYWRGILRMYHGEDKLDVRLSGPGSEKTISSSDDGSSNNKQTGHGIISSQPPAAVHSPEPAEQDSSEAMGVHRPVLTSSTAQHGIPGMSRDSNASQNANIIPGTSPEFKEELLSTRLLEPDQTLTLDSQLQTHVWQSSQSPCVKNRSPEVVNAALLETGHELSEACFAEHALDSPVAYRLQHSLSECPSNQIETVVENSLEVVQQECSLSSFDNFLTKADLPTTLESGELGSLQEDFVVSHDMEQDNLTSVQLTSTVTISEPHSTPSSVCPEESGDVKNIEQATELLEKSRLSGLICEHDQSEMQKLRVIHREQVSELYFLQRGGNMVDLQIFLKKPPPQPLQLFLQEKSLDDVEEEGSSETISASSGHAVGIQHHPAAAVLTSGNSEGPTIHNTTSLAKQASPEGIGPLRSSSRTAALVSSPGSTRVTRQHCSLTSEAGSTGVPVNRNLQTSLPGSHSTGTRGHASSQPRSLSISSVCASAIDGKDDIAERAKQEADIQQRVAHLKKAGLWSLKKLTRVTEPPRPKTHRDYLLEEMQWLAGDFAQERRWKRALAKKLARTVVRFHEEQKQKEERAKKEELSKLRRIAANIAKEVKYFWTNIEKVVQFKQQSLAEEKRKKALDKQLNYIVDQTEKYSDWLSRGLNNSIATSHTGSLSSSPARTEADEDVEETIEEQEGVEGTASYQQELDELAQEGEMPLEDLYKMYASAYEEQQADEVVSEPPLIVEDVGEEVEVKEMEPKSQKESVDSPTISNRDENEDQEMEGDEEGSDLGMKFLVTDDKEPQSQAAEEGADGVGPKKEITDIAAAAESLQPKGYTLATAQVKTPVPFLLRGSLREYQHIGLDWLVTMNEKMLNGILADEMGLGKTIQTIALLGHLACDRGNWGPHLVVVPTSVMLNWEMEFKRWFPAFKILTYYGVPKERKQKRQGWTRPNAFHVCITSYKLVLQDHQAFRRKKWKYLILDEAQNIKNFKSQRWQSLLNFNSQHRLLLTGTPLQNSLMELWSLMHFLMPHVFQSHREFREWFSNPLTGMIEGSQEYNESLVKRLHKVLRPFLLRRIKMDVEKQMPKKYEHIVRCRLSKRQRYLYDDFMSQATTRETLASGHFMSVINILMQLRKVCNHPNLFDPRPITSPFITQGICYTTASLVLTALEYDPWRHVDLSIFDLVNAENQLSRYEAEVFLPNRKVTRKLIEEISTAPDPPPRPKPVRMKVNRMVQPVQKSEGRTVVMVNAPKSLVQNSLQKPLPSTATDGILPTASPAAASGGQIIRNAASAVNPAVATTLTPTSSPVNPTNPLRLVAQASHMAPLAIQGQRAQLVTGYTLPSGVVQQRVVLTPHTQARLPSGEVISIAQLAALANSQGQAGQPLTLHIQGNKLTLACSPIRTLAPGPQHIHIQGGVVHMVKPVSQTQVLAQPGNTKMGMATLPQQQLAGAAISMPARTIAVPVATSTGSAGLVRQVVPAAAHAAATATLGAAPRPSTAAVYPPVRLPFVPAPHAPPARMLTQSSGTPLLRVPTVTPVASPQVAKPGLKAVPAAAPLTRGPTTRSVDRKATAEEAPSKRKDSASAAEAPAPKKPAKRSPLYLLRVEELRAQRQQDRLERIHRINEARCAPKPIYGTEVLRMCDLSSSAAQTGSRPHHHEGAWRWSGYVHCRSVRQCCKPSHPDVFWSQTSTLQSLCINSEQRLRELKEIIERFIFVVPPVESPPISLHAPHPPPSMLQKEKALWQRLHEEMSPRSAGLHRILCNMRTQFPDLRLIQYDCGKLQTLDILLRKFKAGSHRVLIFTQMTRMLDVLEQFLNFHGYIYLRLDGTTRVEQRQFLMDRFNADARIFCFILSTRSGGVGVNLTGADTVVFYDSDWNPTMDAQAQDRCHRIGQTRDVHIYRLISERTVEENILKKANQKRMLGDVAIEGGNFTTAYFKQQTIRELFEMPVGMEDASKKEAAEAVPKQAPSTEEDGAVPSKDTNILELALGKAEDEEDIRAASQARAEQVAELAEFNENAADDGEEGGVGGEGRDEEEPSKAEEEINALVQQLTPIERYALKYLEASIAAETEEPKSTKEQANVSKQDVKLTKADEPKGDDAAKEIQTQETQPEDDALAKTRKRGRPCRRSDTSQAADSSQEIDQSDAVPHDESDMTIDKPDFSELLESASNCTQVLSEASDRACEKLHSPASLQQETGCSFAEQNSKSSGSYSAMSGHPEESQPASAPNQGREELLDAHKGDVLEEGATTDSMMENCCTATAVATSPVVSGVREIDDSERSTRSVMTHADAAGTRDCTNESLESTPENPKQLEDSAAKCIDALETLESPHFDKENQTLHATISADNKFTLTITSQEFKLKNDILKQTDTISPNLDVHCVINANCVNPSVRDEQLNSPVLLMEDPSDSASPVAKDVEQADLPATGNLDASAEICNNGSSSSLTVNVSPGTLEVSTQQRAGSSPVTDASFTDDLEVANIQRQSHPQAEALPAGPADDGSREVEAAEIEKPLKRVLCEDTPSGCDAEDSENAVDGRELPDVKPVMKEERMGKPGRKRKTDLNAIVQSHTECQDSATGKEKPRSPIRTRSGIKSRDTKRSSGMLGARRRLNLRSSSREVNKREKNKSLSRKDLETQKKAGHSDVVKRRVGRPAKIKSPSEHINSSDGETQLYKHNMTGSSPGKDLNQSNSDDQEPQAKILCRQEVDSDDRTSADEAGMPSLPSETCVEGGRSSTPTITRASLRRSVLCQSPARTVDKATRKRRRSSQAASGDERLSGSDSLCISGSDVGAGRTRGGSSSSASRRSPSQAAAALNRRLTRQAIRRGIGYSSDTTESG